jgi:hypothetical protein
VDSLHPLADMVFWGKQQNNYLLRCIKRRDIDPHNLDGAYLYGKTLQLFKGIEGDGTPKSKANVISQLYKKLRNYVFDGTVKGRQKQTAEGELFTLIHYFY